MADGSGVPRPFLVMELVDGQPLSALLRPGESLDPDAVRDLLAQAGDAIGAAHRAGIVHRDIKPANLLVTPDRTIKITDFGIARASEGLGLTGTGQVMGTPQYLSPEQARGEVATSASDVYSLGVVAFECLAGRRPFEAESPVATALAHIQQPVPDLPASVPADLATVVRRALAKDPRGALRRRRRVRRRAAGPGDRRHAGRGARAGAGPGARPPGARPRSPSRTTSRRTTRSGAAPGRSCSCCSRWSPPRSSSPCCSPTGTTTRTTTSVTTSCRPRPPSQSETPSESPSPTESETPELIDLDPDDYVGRDVDEVARRPAPARAQGRRAADRQPRRRGGRHRRVGLAHQRPRRGRHGDRRRTTRAPEPTEEPEPIGAHDRADRADRVEPTVRRPPATPRPPRAPQPDRHPQPRGNAMSTPTPPPPPPGPPLIGGRYELGELLGRGGMAEVRKGTDSRLGRVVAIKRLRTDLASDSTFQARFRREAQSAASLNHPAIVSVYDTGEELATDGSGVAQPYIVMEFVAGRTLRDILREGRKILPERALEITSGVLSALDYSHRAGIIHRDIKPGNVMLTPSGDVKVMDFGIARAMSDSNTMTQTAAVVGTAQYLSPEQARGETVDSRSDVYSAGCLLYELLTGRPAVRRGQPGRRGLPARPRAGRATVGPRRGPAAGRRRDRDEGAGQAARGPLPVGRGDAQRHRALPRRPSRPGTGAGPRARPRLPDPGHGRRAAADRQHGGAAAGPAAGRRAARAAHRAPGPARPARARADRRHRPGLRQRPVRVGARAGAGAQPDRPHRGRGPDRHRRGRADGRRGRLRAERDRRQGRGHRAGPQPRPVRRSRAPRSTWSSRPASRWSRSPSSWVSPRTSRATRSATPSSRSTFETEESDEPKGRGRAHPAGRRARPSSRATP